MSGQHSSGSSGHSSMDQQRIDELEALQPEMEQITISGLPLTELPKRLPQTNTDNWIHMSLLNGVTLTDEKESYNPWAGYLGVGSDSGLGHEDSGGLCISNSRFRPRSNSYCGSLLPKPPSYWKFAVLVSFINPPFGLVALLMCHLTDRHVSRGHLLQAKRRSKQTLVVIVTGFSITVLALVLFVVIMTAQNRYPFRMEPTITERRKPNKHGFDLDYIPPPPVTKPKYKPPPFIPRPVKPHEDVLGNLAKQWEGVNASSFDFTQHDDFARLLESMDKQNSTFNAS